jgi:hypothetical protein
MPRGDRDLTGKRAIVTCSGHIDGLGLNWRINGTRDMKRYAGYGPARS